MGQPYTAIDHRVTREVKSVLHIPLASLAVMISTHEYLTSRPVTYHLNIALRVAYSNITEMQQQVLRLHGLLDIVVKPLREVIRAVAPRLYLIVVKDACQILDKSSRFSLVFQDFPPAA